MRNLNDGISLLEIADSAVSNLSQIVTRVRELAEQAANGSYSFTQRKAMDNEAQALQKEYFRISRSASFNGTNLFDGSLSNGVRLQAGYGVEGSIQSTIGKGLGTGGLEAEVTYHTGTSQVGAHSSLDYGLAAGDVNGDGLLDMITAGYDYEVSEGNQSAVRVLIGRGDGSFQPGESYLTEPGQDQELACTLGDVNNDGMLDIVTAGSHNGQGRLSVLLGKGDGTFGPKLTQITEAGIDGASHAVSMGDVNGDGILDLVTAGGANYSGHASVLIGMGDGTFRRGSTYATEVGDGGEVSFSVALHDLNQDGILDLVTGGVVWDSESVENGQISIRFGHGDGTFGPQATYSMLETPNSCVLSLGFGDVNADGNLDLVAGGNYLSGTAIQGGTAIFLGKGDGTFVRGETYDMLVSREAYCGSIALVDLNGDGALDLAAAGSVNDLREQAAISLRLGYGDGTFDSRTAYVSTEETFFGRHFGLVSSDINGDGILDLLTAGQKDATASASLFINIAREGISPLLPFSLKTQADALQAMAPLDRKLQQLASQRGVIGAFQSRLGVAINTLQSTSENYASAESRIRDTDVASDTAELTRLQMSQQAATAILAQANQAPALAVRLLSGS